MLRHRKIHSFPNKISKVCSGFTGSRRLKNFMNGFIRKEKTSSLWYDNALEFCENTSLHGLKFVGNNQLTLFERIFFLVSFFIALMVLINFIWNVYSKWSTTPVIIGISPVPTYIKQIPFPAVSICNMNQALSSKVNNYKKSSVEYSIVQTLCSRDIELQTDETNQTNDWEIFEKVTAEVTQPCHKMLVACRYGSFTTNCTHLFRPVLTDEGLCCAFNTVDWSFMYKNFSRKELFGSFLPADTIAVDWTPESGYPANLPERFYPRTAAGPGSSMGLSLILDAQLDDYFCSSTNGPGFKALLHNPTESPTIGDSGISLKVGYETRVVINPQVNVASENLRDIKKEYRQCIFANEGNLSYYATYSRRNCEMECEAKLLATACNCIYYYMPRVIPNITICGRKDIECSTNILKKKRSQNDQTYECSEQCLPACFELTFSPDSFSAQIVQGQFSIRDKSIQRMPKGYAKNNIAVIHFYFMDMAFRSNTKEQFIGFTEFLSNTGGLMGLFLGFSVISLVEILYYALFRPYFVSDKKRNNKKISKVSKQKFKSSTSFYRRPGLNSKRKITYTPNATLDISLHNSFGFNSTIGSTENLPFYN